MAENMFDSPVVEKGHRLSVPCGRRLHMAVVMLVCASFGLFGCGDNGSVEADPHATVRQSVPWWVIEFKAPSTLRIVSHVEYCVGEPEPTIAQVNVTESTDAVIITVKAEVARLRQSERNVACLGAAEPLYRNIKLSDPLERRKVLDGSFDPPKLRWPSES